MSHPSPSLYQLGGGGRIERQDKFSKLEAEKWELIVQPAYPLAPAASSPKEPPQETACFCGRRGLEADWKVRAQNR